MEKSQLEQEYRLADKTPTLEEFWDYRLGTSAVYIGIAMGEYANKSSLTSYIFETFHMQTIWNETNKIISITNDLLSLRKELRQGCIDSMIPLSCATGKSAQDAIIDATNELKVAKDRFDNAAAGLIAGCGSDKALLRQLSAFIEVCRSNCVGNLIWRCVDSSLLPESTANVKKLGDRQIWHGRYRIRQWRAIFQTLDLSTQPGMWVIDLAKL